MTFNKCTIAGRKFGEIKDMNGDVLDITEVINFNVDVIVILFTMKIFVFWECFKYTLPLHVFSEDFVKNDTQHYTL